MQNQAAAERVTAPTDLPKPARVFLACTRCRTRKARCDGGTPRCSLCKANDSECTYPALRKTRGPGKKKKAIKNVEETPQETHEPALASTADDHLQLPEHGIELSHSPQVSVSRPPIPIFTGFLHPDVYDSNLEKLKRRIGDRPTGHRLTPLLPIPISKRLTANAFDDVMKEHRILDKAKFLTLLEEQYATSLSDHGGGPARWALVNAVLALELRFKTAAGSEETLESFPRSFYQNAVAVLAELILQPPSLLAVQALQAMAVYAQQIPDPHAFAILSANSLHLSELLGTSRLSPEQAVDGEQYEKAKAVAQALNKAARRDYRLESS